MADKSLVLARPYIPKAEVKLDSVRDAMEAITQQLQGPSLACVLFFGASEIATQESEEILGRAFDCPVIGCTTNGEIGLRYRKQSLIGIGLPASLFRVRFLLEAVEEPSVSRDWPASIAVSSNPNQALGLLFYDDSFADAVQVDAMRTELEARLPLSLLRAGSTSDAVPRIYVDGEFRSGVAGLLVLESRLPFAHFSVTQNDLGTSPALIEDRYHSAIAEMRERMPDILLTLGFESLVQRQSNEQAGMTSLMERLLGPLNIAGFTMGQGTENAAVPGFSGVVFGAG